jgi:hypothetical protein
MLKTPFFTKFEFRVDDVNDYSSLINASENTSNTNNIYGHKVMLMTYGIL